MRPRGTLVAAVVLAGGALAGVGPVAATAAAPLTAPVTPLTAQDCGRAAGTAQPTKTWALQRLGVAKVAALGQGRSVATGQPIRIAVIDSGLDKRHPQLAGVDSTHLQDAVANDPGRKFDDCAQHGTWVTALIAAQHSGSTPGFYGIAPQARIIPIKVTNKADEVTSADVARGIDLAINAHAQIANLSLSIGNDPAVEAAVARARQAKMLIVAAAGNDGAQLNPQGQYPAKYSTRYDNVIAVAATTASDTVADYSDRGSYVDLAAPGDDVQTVAVNGGYLLQKGTSFATPYVTGTAALVLAANPGMTPAQVRDRLEATADPPPDTVPSQRYGYGIVNPYLAVTAVGDDGPAAPASDTPAALHLGVALPGPDRTLQHVALGGGFALLGLAALVITGAAVLRGRDARAGRRT